MPDKEYRAKDCFFLFYHSFNSEMEVDNFLKKHLKGLCDTQMGGFDTGNVNETGHLDVYRQTVYNPQSDRDNNKKDWGPGYFTLRNSQEYRQSHDPVGYKKLESFQELLFIFILYHMSHISPGV